MKCLTLCCILVWSAQAVQLTTTTVGVGTAQAGQTTRLRAGVTPRTVSEGTVAFFADGIVIPGCEAAAVQSGEATCDTSFPKSGVYGIGASYTGAANWSPSTGFHILNVERLSSSVYIAMDPLNPVYGQGLILQALALGADQPKPTGTFTFADGGVNLVERRIRESDNRAALDMFLKAGRHAINATYNGDGAYTPRTTPTLYFTVAKGTPVVAISSTPAQLGQTVVVTVSVTALNPTGTVTFQNLPGCAQITLENGIAQCRTTYGQLGDFPLTATYSGDSNLNPGGATMRMGVTKAVAGIFVAIAPGAPVFGQSVKVTALALGAPGLPAPVGALVFSDGASQGGVSAFDAEGRGSWSGVLPVGQRRVSVMYSGDLYYAASQSAVDFVVAKANTSTVLTNATGGVLTATVAVMPPAIGSASGSVRFYRDGVPAGVVPLAGGTATLVSSQVGNYLAEYLGDGNCNGSVSAGAAPVASNVQVTLASDRNPAAPGQPVAFTAVVSPNPGTVTPSGAVEFTADGVSLGTVNLTSGRATLSAPLPAGQHAIVATYSGDAHYPAASSSLTQVITGAAAGMGLRPSVAIPVFGEPVTFTVQLAAASSTGTVQFSDGGVPLGSAVLAGGVASLTVSTLTAGRHTISASWAGDATFAGTSADLPYQVEKAPTTITVTLGTGAAAAQVTAVSPGGGVPSGNVRFVNALTSAPLGAAAIAKGAATAALGSITGPFAAVYDGDENFQPSISRAVNPVVVANAASYWTETVAPDEIVSLFGPLLAGIATAQVTDSAGETRQAQVLHSAAGQAGIVMPADLAVGPAVVWTGGYAVLVTVNPVSPGVFTADATGTGSPAGVAGPIEIGDDGAELVLYGTGFRRAKAVTCTIGEVLYAGPQGELPGLDQINLRLPASLRGAGVVGLELMADGVAANRLTLTVH